MKPGQITDNKTKNLTTPPIFFLLFLSIYLGCHVAHSERELPSVRDIRITPTVLAVNKVLPSVVNLSTERIVTESYSPFGDDFPDIFMKELITHSPLLKRKVRSYSLGSGCILTPDGLIVTNAHVVYRATKIYVTLNNGETFLAREIASADLNDIALLKIINLPKNKKLSPLQFATAGDLILGETVIAVGNPYGLGNSISRGILSAVGRQAVYDGKVVLKDILQTDAAINPGNSGGPLINIYGQMIGINMANHKLGQGIGFAIPLTRIENLLAKWLIPERFGNYDLGILPAEKITKNGRLIFYLQDVVKDSPAWHAGLRKNDIIIKYNGKPIEKLIELSRSLWKKKAGDIISLTMESGSVYTITIKQIPLSDGKSLARIKLGLGLVQLTKQIAKALNYPFTHGIIVSKNNSSNQDIKRGDILVRLGDVPIYSFSDIGKALKNKTYGEHIQAVFISVIKEQQQYYLLKRVVILEIK